MVTRIFGTLTTVLILTACANQGGSSVRTPVMSVDYGVINNIRRVQMPSAAPAGAMVGGFTGLVLSSGRSSSSRVASGIGGAALGALATSALEGDRRGYQYSVRFNDGNYVSFTTEKSFLRVGDCVAVERGQYSNIRRVPDTMCNSRNQHPNVTVEYERMARQCIDAKDQLLASSTNEEIELATMKVSVLCQNFDG